MSPKFKADCQYIQETYHINGGEVPDKDFADDLKYYIERYEAVKDNTDPYFVAAHDLIKDRYNFKLYV